MWDSLPTSQWCLFNNRCILSRSTHTTRMHTYCSRSPKLGRADTFEGFCWSYSWQYSCSIVSRIFFNSAQLLPWFTGFSIQLSQGLHVNCQINFICNLKFTRLLVFVVLLMSQSLTKPVIVPKTEECCTVYNQQRHRGDKVLTGTRWLPPAPTKYGVRQTDSCSGPCRHSWKTAWT